MLLSSLPHMSSSLGTRLVAGHGPRVANQWRMTARSAFRSSTSTATKAKHSFPHTNNRSRFLYTSGGLALGAFTAFAQYKYGSQKDFFDYRFYTTADPDDLASFYGSEAFMDVFCVMPFMGTLMMRGGHFDEEGTVHTTGFPGEMQVSMVFSDEMDDADGRTKWFNKRERFRDVLFGFTCWDMVTNFGFERQEDGRILVYHHGEYFHGRVPPLSLLVRFVFGLHARWVAWATEHHINHYAFRDESEVDEELEEQSRVDMPLFLLRNYAWSDLMAGLWGSKVKKPSFLVLKSAQAAREADDQQDDTDDSEQMQERLPIHRAAIQRRITLDIHIDRHHTHEALSIDNNNNNNNDTNGGDKAGDTKVPLEEALRRTRTLTHRLTKREDAAAEHPADSLQPRETLGGNAAWEALRSTNNPKAYKALTSAAKERQLQRRATQATEEQDH